MKKTMLPYILSLFGYLFLTAIIFFPVLFQGLAPATPDSVSPMATSIALDLLKEEIGRYPLWQPWSFSGMPTVEAFTYLNGLYYPGVLLGLFGIDGLLLQLLHFVFAGLGGFVLLRHVRLRDTAAFLGGAAFLMTPYMITMFVYGHGSQLMTAAYMPWILWAALRLLGNMRPADMGILALLLGFQLQRGHVQIVYYTWLLLILLVLMTIVWGEPVLRYVRKYTMLFAALGIALILSAVVYLPVFEYAPFSVRGAGSGGGASYGYATMWSMHPREFITYLLPGAVGFGGITYWGEMPFTDYPNYAGLVVLLLAMAGFILERHQAFVRFLGVSLVLMVLLSFGKYFSPVYDLFYHTVPFFNRFRVPSMALIVASFDLALLAGFGLNAVTKALSGKWMYYLNIAMLVIAASALVFLIGQGLVGGFVQSLFPAPRVENVELAGLIDTVRWNLWKSSFFWMAGIGGLFAALLWLRSKALLGMALTNALLVILALADIYIVDRQIVSPAPDTLRPSRLMEHHTLDMAFEEDDITGYLSADTTSAYRVYPAGNLFSENKFSVFGIESVGGYHPAKLRLYDEVLRATNNLASIKFLRLLNVRYVLSTLPIEDPQLDLVHQGELRLAGGPSSAVLYRLAGTLPRAWFVREGIAADPGMNVVESVLGGRYDAGQQALVEKAPWRGKRTFGKAEILSLSVGPERIEVSVNAEEEAFLVLSEVFYPLRWKVSVDEQEESMYRTNGLLRGVLVPEGKHDIVFSFDRGAFENGKKLSFAGLAMALVLVGTGLSALQPGRNPL